MIASRGTFGQKRLSPAGHSPWYGTRSDEVTGSRIQFCVKAGSVRSRYNKVSDLSPCAVLRFAARRARPPR